MKRKLMFHSLIGVVYERTSNFDVVRKLISFSLTPTVPEGRLGPGTLPSHLCLDLEPLHLSEVLRCRFGL